MEDRTIIYQRDKLYEEVWSEPAMTVAKRYSVSGTALAKTCRKLAVPLPPRGYWAKVQAGQRIPRTPLPPYAGKTEMRTVIQMPTEDPLKTKAEKILADGPEMGKAAIPVLVPKILESPHPLIRKTISAYLKPRMDDYGMLWGGTDTLTLRVGPASLDRALRIYDTLLKTVEKLGGQVGFADQAGRYSGSWKTTYVVVLGEKIEIAITETAKRRDHVLTPEEQKTKDKDGYLHAPRYDFSPSGEMTFKITSIGGGGSRTEWNESSRRPLETRLGDVLEGLKSFAAYRIAARQERARKEEEKKAIHARLAEFKERREAEKQRVERLDLMVNRWHEAKRVRAFVDAVRQSGLRDENWIAWALGHADTLDPLREAPPSALETTEDEIELEKRLQDLRWF